MVTKLFNTSILGQFHVIKNITVILGLDILAPILDPLVTTFAKVKNDAKKLTYRVQITFAILMAVTIPITVFFYFFPFVIIDFLLGDKWKNTYDLMSALSIMFLTLSAGWFLNNCFVALGNVKSLFVFDLVSLIFTFTILYLLGQNDIIEFTLIRSALAVIVTLSFFYYLGRFINFSYIRMTLLLLPVLLSSVLAAYLTNEVKVIRFEWSILNLAFLGSVYFVSYFISLILTSTIFIGKLEEFKHIKDAIFNMFK